MSNKVKVHINACFNEKETIFDLNPRTQNLEYVPLFSFTFYIRDD